MVEFSDCRDVKAWLQDKDPMWALLLAVRTAARSLPYYIMSEGHRSQAWLMMRIIFFSQLGIKANYFVKHFRPPGISAAPGAGAAEVNVKLHQDILNFTSANGIETRSFDLLMQLLESCSEHGSIASHINGILTQENEVDANSLIENIQPDTIATLPLWRPRVENPFYLEFTAYRKISLSKDPNSAFWFNWYQSLLDGTAHKGLTEAQQYKIYMKIAEFPEALWADGIRAVNLCIADLLKELKSNPSQQAATCLL